MFSELANWANDAAAVEKFLRLLQALAQIAAGTSLTAEDAVPWSKAKGQFALARRYLRLFKWIDCSKAAQKEWNTLQTHFRRLLSTAKWILLALYFFMEMFCITNAMTITSLSQITVLQHHALQTWFVAILVSIFLNSYDLLFSPSINTSQTYTNLLVDFCDILIPGSAVGWIDADSVTVGIASSISSLVAGKQIWGRVQMEARKREEHGKIAKADAVGKDEGVVSKVVVGKKTD